MPSKHSLTILKLMIVIILLGLYYSYFFRGVIKSYNESLTNLASREEEFEGTNVPTVIICMRPAWKTSVLEQYNITKGFFQMKKGSYEHLDMEITMQKIVSEASFRLNQDFKIGISDMYPDPFSGIDLKIGLNMFQIDGEEYTLNVTDVYSLLKGVCYTISSSLPISSRKSYSLSVRLVDNMADNPDKVELITVPDQDSLGIIFQNWETAKMMKEQIIDFETGATLITLHETKITRIVGCNENAEPKQKCFAQKVNDFLMSFNCSVKCKPKLVKSFFDRYIEDGKSPPDCVCLRDEHCAFWQFLNVAFLYAKCESRCKTTEYSGRASFSDQEFLNSGDGNKSADIILYYGATSRTLVQEYWVYDTEGMIGTLGGSLGLFLGFSFYGFISDLLDLFWKAIAKQD